MELKRAAAPNGRQPAWPRRHRTTAKPGQRQRRTPPAASRQGSGAPAFWAVIAGQVRPKVGARHRAPFLPAVHSNARALHPRARSVRGRARVVHRRARPGHCGVQLLLEWMWSSLASLFRPMSSDGDGRLSVGSTSRQRLRAVLSKEWPDDGENGHMMEENMGSHGDSVPESGGPAEILHSGPCRMVNNPLSPPLEFGR
jgi:hypothetical protein